MASSIYDRSRTFFSLRGHGCNGAYDPDYGVEEVSAAVKNPVCELTLQPYTPASRSIARCGCLLLAWNRGRLAVTAYCNCNGPGHYIIGKIKFALYTVRGTR